MSVPAASEWRGRPERGSPWLVRFMAWLSITIGRSASRIPLRLIALYFFLTAGSARTHARAFLARALGRAPSLAEEFRLFFTFSTTIHDRVFFLRDRFDLFDIDVHGTDAFDSEGALLMGGHVGSFEVLRACGRQLGKRRVAMAMHEENPRVSRILADVLGTDGAREVIALGRPQSMLDLAARLEEGALVGVLADRVRGDEPALRVEFMGAPAAFPIGPMRMAAALRRRVIFMSGVHRGGNRYEVRFEPLADFTGVESLTRDERDAKVREAIAAYARRLEEVARGAPDNWFNFHDFWA